MQFKGLRNDPVGDGLVPSRCPGERVSDTGDHNAPARARGRPYD